MADDERNSVYPQSSPPITPWSPGSHIYPHSHHGTPTHEFTGFNFGTMEPSAFTSNMQQQQRHPSQLLHPLVMPTPMPQWPSQIQHHQPHAAPYQQPYQPMYSQPIQAIQPISMGGLPTPVSATSLRSATTPRKTLTDQDRKKMCQYAEEHPSSKQTEIGAIFGVERSTVSKVLRQKDKYLFQDDGSRSPIKRAKGRSPDIERALAVWAKNQERRGVPLTDELIRDKARTFVATTANPEGHQALTLSWIEKFKLKNNLMGARSRKGSLVPDDCESICAAASCSQTPNDNSPGSPNSSTELRSAESQESLKDESPESYHDHASRQGPFHSQSTTSLHSAFTDSAPSSFSPGPTSPFFTPDSGTAPGAFVPALPGLPVLPQTTINVNAHRPRSQTFPLLEGYMVASAGSESLTPKYHTNVLDSPMEELPDPLTSIDEAVAPHEIPVTRQQQQHNRLSPAEAMRPPPLPAHVTNAQRELTPASSTSSQQATSPDDARRAMEVVLSFFEQQPQGFLDMHESITVGKLMEKLKLQARADSISR